MIHDHMRRLLPSLLLALVACAPKIAVTPLNPAPRPLAPRAVGEVEVFTTRLPPRPYAEVSLITARQGQAGDHLDALRAKAAELGCDGLVMTVMPTESSVQVQPPPGQEGSAPARGHAVGSSSGTCVVWTAPGAPGAAPPPAQIF